MFSVVEELSSPAFRKFAALVSPKRGYPELPDLSDIPRPSSVCVCVRARVCVCVCARARARVCVFQLR
jgi:hypothetical protein